MFKFNELNQVHLEITNNCQASCPMCDRNVRGGLENPLIKINEWTIDDFKTIISPEVINQVSNLYFCGNYGDPAMNNDLPKMIEYIQSVKDISIAVHTNGGMRKPEWWAEFGKLFQQGHHRVIFALDGLEDTHHLYRVGTTYEKVVENARAFISAGGTANWAFLRFKHNEHQVDEAKRRAEELGFTQFILKDTIRFNAESKYDVWDKHGAVTHSLEPASHTEIKFIPKELFKYENAKKFVDSIEVDCKVKRSKEVYIDAHGHLYPCCFIGHATYSAPDPGNKFITGLKPLIADQTRHAVELLGGIDAIDVKKRSVKDIVDSEEYQTVWQQLWDEKKLWICSKTCGKAQDLSTWEDQFREYNSFNQHP